MEHIIIEHDTKEGTIAVRYAHMFYDAHWNLRYIILAVGGDRCGYSYPLFKTGFETLVLHAIAGWYKAACFNN